MEKTGGESEEASYNSFGSSLPPMLLLTFVFFLNFISRVIFSPLLPEIETDLGLDHAASGSFFLFISAGYFISILLSGFVAAKIGNKRAIILSTLGCGAMLIVVGNCTSITTIRIALFFLGFGAGLYLQSGLATILQLVSPSHLARGMAVHELAPNCGFVIAPLLTTLMLYFVDWREGIQLLGAVLFVAALVYGLKGRGGTKSAGGMKISVMHAILKMPEFWCMVLLFSFAICSTLGMYAMLPLYLVAEHGMEPQYANTLVSLSRVSSVFMPLAGGWLGDKYGNGRVLVGVLLVTAILTVPIGLVSGSSLLLCIVLQPMVAVCFFPSGFAVLSSMGGEKFGGATVSLCIPMAFLTGGGLLPTLIGVAGDHFSLALGFSSTGLVMVVVALLGARSRAILSR